MTKQSVGSVLTRLGVLSGLSLVSLAAVTSMPKSANALNDSCNNVRLSVFNDHPVEVKVTQIEYYDYDQEKWRSEALVSRKIETTKSYQFVRDLEHVKNDDTKIRVTYKEHLGGTRWGSDQTRTGNLHECTEGEYNRMHLPGPSVYDQP